MRLRDGVPSMLGALSLFVLIAAALLIPTNILASSGWPEILVFVIFWTSCFGLTALLLPTARRLFFRLGEWSFSRY